MTTHVSLCIIDYMCKFLIRLMGVIFFSILFFHKCPKLVRDKYLHTIPQTLSYFLCVSLTVTTTTTATNHYGHFRKKTKYVHIEKYICSNS